MHSLFNGWFLWEKKFFFYRWRIILLYKFLDDYFLKKKLFLLAGRQAILRTEKPTVTDIMPAVLRKAVKCRQELTPTKLVRGHQNQPQKNCSSIKFFHCMTILLLWSAHRSSSVLWWRTTIKNRQASLNRPDSDISAKLSASVHLFTDDHNTEKKSFSEVKLH